MTVPADLPHTGAGAADAEGAQPDGGPNRSGTDEQRPGGPEVGIAALHDLRRMRRRNRFRDVHWIDTLYQAYLAALVGGGAALYAVASVPDEPLDAAGVAQVLDRGPAVVGMVVAVLVVAGMRSGLHGGPLNLEPATVAHELQAPVPRRAVLRAPALKQLRTLAFGAAVVGATGGLMASHRLDGSPGLWVGVGALTVVLAVTTAFGAALVVSGRRLGALPVGIASLALLGWAALDLVLGVTTSPFGLAGHLATWPLEAHAATALAPLLALATLALGLASLETISTEAALRRSGLVSQLRFAATMQDVRTVVLLRRQLARERPRNRPWVAIGGIGWLHPVWQRDLQGLLRQPGLRLVRMVALAIVAGLSAGLAWHGTILGLVAAGFAMYVAAYDAVEPIAQEVDHPTRWDALPGDQGRILLHHLTVAFLIMLALTGVATAASLLVVPGAVVGALAPTVVLPVAAGATMAAALATSLGPADPTALGGAGAEMMGLLMVLRTAIPVAVAVAPLLALLPAGHDPAALDLEAVANASTWPLLVVLATGLYVRSRRPFTV